MTYHRCQLDSRHIASSDAARGVGPTAVARLTPKLGLGQGPVIAEPSARRLREEVIKWVSNPRFTHALTLNINRAECTLRTAGGLFGRFCKEVDRMMLGKRRVERVPTICRLEAIAFPEHRESNLHLHVVANFARRYWGGHAITEEQQVELSRIWHRVRRQFGP